MLVAVPFISYHEGESLKSYQDVAGVWTICRGETLGVKSGQKVTKDYCATLTNSRTGQFMQEVYSLIKVDVSPETLAAHTSFAYNVGVDGYKRSKALQETNKGNVAIGCHLMANWYTVNGKDCRIRVNNCYGLWLRRQDEINLCLSGL